MRTLLALLVAICFCLVPIVVLAGNTNPHLYLEIYMYGVDPDYVGTPPEDPNGCMVDGTCPELCFHNRPWTGSLQCWSPKAPYQFGIVPIHVGALDTEPFGQGLAQGWPLPCGPGGGYVTISTGITRSGTAATFLGFTACPFFLAGPSNPPGDILFSATAACHDWTDHPCYGKWMATSSASQTSFRITGNVNDTTYVGTYPISKIINCQLGTECDSLVVGAAPGDTTRVLHVAGSAQWGGTQTIVCGASGPTSVQVTTWGRIKALYR